MLPNILCCVWQSWQSFSSGNSGPETKPKFKKKTHTQKSIFLHICLWLPLLLFRSPEYRSSTWSWFSFSSYIILSLQHHWELFLFQRFSISMAFVTCRFTFFCSFHFYSVYDSVEVDWHAQRLSTCFVYARTVQLLCRPAVCRVWVCAQSSEWWCLFLGQ